MHWPSLENKMLLVDFFSKDCCKGTELIEGWYFYDDADDSVIGGPYPHEKAALTAAHNGESW